MSLSSEKQEKDENSPKRRGPGRPPTRPTGRKATKIRMEAAQQAEKKAEERYFVSTLGSSILERASIAESHRIGFQELLKTRQPQGDYVPSFLDSLKRDDSWNQIATVRTLDVTFWFDIQNNDYNSHSVAVTAPIDITWIGNSFIAPKGAHARRFLIGWKDPLPISSTMKELAVMRRKPVVRWTYVCNGTCSAKPGSKQRKGFTSANAVGYAASDSDSEGTAISSQVSDDEDSDDDSYVDPGDVAEEKVVIAQPRRRKCSGHVKLHLEVLANNLELVHIWQQNEHDDATPEQGLNWSRGLHNEVGHALRLFGVKPFTVMKTVVRLYGFPSDIAGRTPKGTSVAFPNVFPSWRLPTYKKVSNMMPAIKRRERLHRDPFQAVRMMFERHPDQMYFYEPHDDNVPDDESNFSCAISTNFALEALILHGSQDGVGLDTSWRNKNENRAAVSFLIAVDRQGHLTPGAVLISANVKSNTIEKFLDETETRVINRATVIVKDGLECIIHPDSQDRRDILAVAQHIVEKKQWFILKWMIDKSASLLSGIKKHDNTATILVCQFHIVQAIIRVDGGDGRIPDAPSIPYHMKYEIVKAFRQVQRCRSIQEWGDYHQVFVDSLQRILMNTPPHDEDPLNRQEISWSDENQTGVASPSKKTSRKRQKGRSLSQKEREDMFQFLERFFDENWFSDYWLEHVTDIGLPDGETRNGTFYTNNWLDRLVGIIMADFFPFYETIGPRNPRIPWEILNSNFEAYQLWDMDKIQHVGDRRYSVAILTPENKMEYHIVDLSIPKCHPRCVDYNQTGKACLHIRAARLLEVNGPVSDWVEVETSNQRSLGTSTSKSKRAIQLRLKKRNTNHEGTKGPALKEGMKRKIKFPQDARLDRQLERMVEALGKDTEYVVRPGRTTGRPLSPQSWIEDRPRQRVKMAPLREAEGFRSGYLATPGRPGHIPPMAPWRNKGIERKSTRFSRKPGKQRETHIHPNSLFTSKVFGKSRSVKLKRAGVKTSRSQMPYPTQSTVPLANTNKNTYEEWEGFTEPTSESGLTKEDIDIASVDMTRWNEPDYTLRVDEMDVLVEILNACSQFMGVQRWFTVSIYADGVLEALTTQKSTEYHERIRSRLINGDFDTLVFLDITGSPAHWTCWVYTISRAGVVRCQGINSLSDNSSLENVDRTVQLAIIKAYVELKYPKAPMRLIQITYDSLNTGLQQNDSSCGFWALFLAFVPLIEIRVELLPQSLQIHQVKFWLGRFWRMYFTDIEGVRGKEINEIHTNLKSYSTKNDLVDPGVVIARRPSSRKEILIVRDLCRLQPGEEEKYIARLAKPKFRIVIEHEPLDSREFGRLLGHTDSGWLSDAILNAYFSVFLKDLQFERGVHGLQLPWFIASTNITRTMAGQPRQKPFKPRDALRSKKSWFPTCNIFELEELILPWHISRGAFKHWILIRIQPQHHRVRVYDSLGSHLKQYHDHACQRVLNFLEFEHSQRYPDLNFPPSWERKLEDFIKDNTSLGPKQPDNASCGIFVIINAENLCKGTIPNDSQVYSATTVQEERRRIALRLSREELLYKELTESPEPVPEEPLRDEMPKPGSSPKSELLDRKSNSGAVDEDMSSLAGMLNVWNLWFRPEDKLFWPGRITEVDHANKSCVVVIPYELIPGAAAGGSYVMNKRPFDIAEDLIQVATITPAQIAPIRWPAYLDPNSVPEEIRQYANNADIIEWDQIIAPIKRPFVDYLRTRLSDVTAAVYGEKTLLPDLTTEATTILKSRVTKPRQTLEYIEGHSRLLDAYDREIIMHLASWEICKRPSNSTNSRKEEFDWQLGFGASILAYIAMGWYLKIREEQAYELYDNARLILPRSVAEQAWELMSRVLNEEKKLGETIWEFYDFEVGLSAGVKHKIVDFSMHLPHVTISPEYVALQLALNEVSMEQPSASDVSLTGDLKGSVGIDAVALEEHKLDQAENSEAPVVSQQLINIPETRPKIRVPGGKAWADQSTSVLARLRPRKQK